MHAALIEDHVDEELSPCEQQLFDKAEPYGQMKDPLSVQTPAFAAANSSNIASHECRDCHSPALFEPGDVR